MFEMLVHRHTHTHTETREVGRFIRCHSAHALFMYFVSKSLGLWSSEEGMLQIPAQTDKITSVTQPRSSFNWDKVACFDAFREKAGL